MNIIPLGYQCFSARGLKAAGFRAFSLPLDYITSPLPSTLKLLQSLKSSDFNMQELLKMFLSTKRGDVRNILGFSINHFMINQWKRYIESGSDYIEPTKQEYLTYEEKYRLSDTYCETTHPHVYTMFERRFNRLKDMFYTQSNILVYNDIHVHESYVQKWDSSLSDLMKINPLNRMIYITYSDRERLPIENIEIYRIPFTQDVQSIPQKSIDQVIVSSFENIS